MIKRRFYRFEHRNRDDPSGSSSSSSDSEVEVAETEVDEDEDDEIQEEGEENIVSDVREKGEASSSSGYESEGGSANEVNLDSSGLPTSDDEVTTQNSMQNRIATAQQSPEKDKIEFDVTDCVLKCKSVFKCKLCPRIVCLSEDTIKAHLISKRHARSEKLRKEGRLKRMLNDDGQIEGETDSDNPDSTVSGQESARPKKKRKGPWKQWKRSGQETKSGKARPSKDKRAKRRKNDN